MLDLMIQAFWFLILTIVMIFVVFGLFMIWMLRESIGKALRETGELWRRTKNEEFSEQEIWRNIQHNRSRGNKIAVNYWTDLLNRKYPSEKE